MTLQGVPRIGCVLLTLAVAAVTAAGCSHRDDSPSTTGREAATTVTTKSDPLATQRQDVSRYVRQSAPLVRAYLNSIDRIASIARAGKTGRLPRTARAKRFRELRGQMLRSQGLASRLPTATAGTQAANRFLTRALAQQANAAAQLARALDQNDHGAIKRARRLIKASVQSFRGYSTQLTREARRTTADITPFTEVATAFAKRH